MKSEQLTTEKQDVPPERLTVEAILSNELIKMLKKAAREAMTTEELAKQTLYWLAADRIESQARRLDALRAGIAELDAMVDEVTESCNRMQHKILTLESENKALRNLANNLRPGPISMALAGDMAAEYAQAGVEPRATVNRSQACKLLAAFHVAVVNRQRCGDEAQPALRKAVAACMAAMGITTDETPDAQCQWELDGSYTHSTSCGNQYTFGEASEQDMFAFCPFCGEQPVTTDKGAAQS